MTRFALSNTDTRPVANRVHANGQPGKVRVPAKGTKIALQAEKTAVEAEQNRVGTHTTEGQKLKERAQELNMQLNFPQSTQSNTSKEKTVATSKKVPAKKATKKAAKRIPSAAKPKTPTNSCLCGCGTKCFGTFAPGHDARLKGLLARGEMKSPNAAQLAFAKKHGIKPGSKKLAPKKVNAGT